MNAKRRLAASEGVASGDGVRRRIMATVRAPEVSSRRGCIYVCMREKCTKPQSYPAYLPKRPRRAL